MKQSSRDNSCDNNCKSSYSSNEYLSIDAVPRTNKKAPRIKKISPNKNRDLHPSIWLALVVMSLTGFVAVILHFKQQSPEPDITSRLATNQKVKQQTEAPKLPHKEDKTTANSSQTNTFNSNINIIAKNCAKLVTLKKSFAVFEHGTCVLLIEPLEDPVLSARSTLKILASHTIEFEVQVLQNNNYLITFDDYLFCWLFADELAKSKDAIMKDPRLARSKNDSPKIKALSELELRVGKLARLCLLSDSKNLNIKKIIRAKRPDSANLLPNTQPQQPPKETATNKKTSPSDSE